MADAAYPLARRDRGGAPAPGAAGALARLRTGLLEQHAAAAAALGQAPMPLVNGRLAAAAAAAPAWGARAARWRAAPRCWSGAAGGGAGCCICGCGCGGAGSAGGACFLQRRGMGPTGAGCQRLCFAGPTDSSPLRLAPFVAALRLDLSAAPLPLGASRLAVAACGVDTPQRQGLAAAGASSGGWRFWRRHYPLHVAGSRPAALPEHITLLVAACAAAGPSGSTSPALPTDCGRRARDEEGRYGAAAVSTHF
jgi:hypothetical protein